MVLFHDFDDIYGSLVQFAHADLCGFFIEANAEALQLIFDDAFVSQWRFGTIRK